MNLQTKGLLYYKNWGQWSLTVVRVLCASLHTLAPLRRQTIRNSVLLYLFLIYLYLFISVLHYYLAKLNTLKF